jgi:hypothetical protein
LAAAEVSNGGKNVLIAAPPPPKDEGFVILSFKHEDLLRFLVLVVGDVILMFSEAPLERILTSKSGMYSIVVVALFLFVFLSMKAFFWCTLDSYSFTGVNISNRTMAWNNNTHTI